MRVFAETERLWLRQLEHGELQRLAELIGDWEVVRWLTVVPFPYTLRDAEEFYRDMHPPESEEPQFFTLALKADNRLIGGIGLHPPRTTHPEPGEVEIGYWLARDFWNRGLMGEAARAAVAMGFARPETRVISATADPANIPSQRVLRKAGLVDCGIMPRPYEALRGSDHVVMWRLTREQYERGMPA